MLLCIVKGYELRRVILKQDHQQANTLALLVAAPIALGTLRAHGDRLDIMAAPIRHDLGMF